LLFSVHSCFLKRTAALNNGLLCADVPLRNYSLNQSRVQNVDEPEQQLTIGVRARGAAPRLGQNHYFSGKTIIFRAKAKFFWQKPAAKNEKNIFFVFIIRKKRN